MINIFADFTAERAGAAVYRQGNAPQTLPDKFFTVRNYNTNDEVRADNAVKTVRWDWTIIYYTKDIADLYEAVESAKETLSDLGYEIDGVGYDYQGTYDEWFARAFDVTKIETKEN